MSRPAPKRLTRPRSEQLGPGLLALGLAATSLGCYDSTPRATRLIPRRYARPWWNGEASRSTAARRLATAPRPGPGAGETKPSRAGLPSRFR